MAALCPLGDPSKKLDLIEDKLDRVLRRVESIEQALAQQVLDPNRCYTRAETARLLRVSERTVDRYIRKDILHSVSRGRSVLIEGQSIVEIIHRTRQRASMEVLRL